MGPPKRTYGRHKTSSAHLFEDPEPSDSDIWTSKRRKPTPPSPERIPRSHVLNGGGKPRDQKNPQQRNGGEAQKNNKARSFSGPTSLPGEEMDLDDENAVEEQDPFERTVNLAKCRNAPKLQAKSLYGGGRSGLTSYSAQLKNQRREEKKRNAIVHDVSDDSSVDGGIELHSNNPNADYDLGSDDLDVSVHEADITPLDAALPSRRKLSPAEASALAFRGREYMATQTPPPRGTLYGNAFDVDSDLAKVWWKNQANSPLLRLPQTVRQSIYAYALGGHAIEVSFRTFCNDTTTGESRSVMRYLSEVYDNDDDYNPLHGWHMPNTALSVGMTLLNRVCRQLYLETSTLPYGLNQFFFESCNHLFNYVVMEDRLTRQQREAFTSITVARHLPGPAILAMLPNLEQVRLMRAVTIHETGDWVVVKNGEERELVKAAKLPKVNMRGGAGSYYVNNKYGRNGGSRGYGDTWYDRL